MNKEIKEMAMTIMATEYFDDGASCSKYKCQENCNCGGCELAEELYKAGYRKVDKSYEQLQKENNRLKNAYDLILKQLKCFKDENERLYKMKRDLEDYIIEQGWQEYVGEETSKTVWHKVADGDLPEENAEIYCCCNTPIGLAYRICSFFIDSRKETPLFYYYDMKDGCWASQDDVIAWTELPTYGGEE